MVKFEIISDLEPGREIWERTVPRDSLTDLWEVRDCFQRCFRRPAAFIVAREGDEITGFLPLSWIEEAGVWGYFPGETWNGKTWLEGNRLPARDLGVLPDLLACAPGPCRLRYLLPRPGLETIDETGYLFAPPDYGYGFDKYLAEFSSKSRKRLRKEMDAFHSRGVEFLYDRPEDFDLIVEMNISRFGEASYFADPRFRESFRELAGLLRERGWLRMTTVLVEGRPAACDLGAVYNGVYTLLAGGTGADYPGAAKLINLHHIERACRERFELVDFLCGDFSWKTLFHLTPRPLYLITSPISDED
ncbi:MAG: GNAT family N-acetyltransferase [Candidatus Erginobacter occultus]|nr:GNAT family N-acetyltransferase [Candidatus Erginobacter occultus]